MAKSKPSVPAPTKPVTTLEAPKAPNVTITLDLHPTAKAEGLQAVTAAQGLMVVDRESHETVKRVTKGWKARKREIEGWHREKMLDPLKKATDWARDQMKDDLGRFDLAIAAGEKIDVDYTRGQQRREQEEADRRRRVAEEDERTRREKEAAEAEAAAEKLEASSVLSAREATFVRMFVKTSRTVALAVACAKDAGYKDAVAAVKRLMDSKKINEAIANADKAAAIRREAEAKAQAPIIVTTAPVESQVAAVSGVAITTNYSCEKFDAPALLRFLADGYGKDDEVTAAVDLFLLKNTPSQLSPLQRMLDAQARRWKEAFSRLWPMAVLRKDHGVRS